jgi:hypothetical protein
MTIPIERAWAIRNVELFLKSLLDSKETPRVPKEIRRRAGRLLKHYPSQFYIEQAQELAPSIFGDPHRDQAAEE